MLDAAIGAIFLIGLSFQITAIWETPTPLRLPTPLRFAPPEPSKVARHGWFDGRNAGDH